MPLNRPKAGSWQTSLTLPPKHLTLHERIRLLRVSAIVRTRQSSTVNLPAHSDQQSSLCNASHSLSHLSSYSDRRRKRMSSGCIDFETGICFVVRCLFRHLVARHGSALARWFPGGPPGVPPVVPVQPGSFGAKQPQLCDYARAACWQLLWLALQRAEWCA